jgi:hypothetical protein
VWLHRADVALAAHRILEINPSNTTSFDRLLTRYRRFWLPSHDQISRRNVAAGCAAATATIWRWRWLLEAIRL